MAVIIPSTVSPTIGTPVHNTSGYDEIVVVTGSATASGAHTITALCDSSATPTTQVASNNIQSRNLAATTYATVAFVVPNGFYWTITGTLAAISSGWIFQIQQGSVNVVDVTSSRALSTVYQNTTGNAIFIYPQLGVTTGQIFIYHDTFSPPTTAAWNSNPSDAGTYTPYAIIPNGDYYKVVSTGATLTKWIEAQLPLQATRTDVTASRAVNTIYQNTSTESVFEVPIVHGSAGVIGNRYTQFLNVDTVTPPVTFETAWSDTASGEQKTLAGFVGVNYYFENTISGATENLDKWWKYTFAPQTLTGKPILQCAQP